MVRKGVKLCVTLVLLACMALLVPDIAWARAGSGRSMGSRGAKTYTPPSYHAQPLQRSTAPRPQSTPNYQSQPQPAFTPQPQMGYGAPRSGWSPFWSGMAGGFLGMGIANMLFGHSNMYGPAYPGHASGMATPGTGAPVSGSGNAGQAFGGLLQLLFFGGMIWLGWRMLRRRTGYAASPFSSMFSTLIPGQRTNYTAPLGSAALGYGASGAGQSETPLAITAADQEAIGALLLRIQAAWDSGDLERLRPLTTSEMQKYFSEALAANNSRGLANKVEKVRLLQAEILESWAEYDMEYATARLRWRALDYMVRLDNQRVVEGDASTPEEIEEIWTVTRARGGNWLLSAIQQTA
ncbi:MAG: TIM44-like domain-containing protein [Alphaproteobacteria bacterium]